MRAAATSYAETGCGWLAGVHVGGKRVNRQHAMLAGVFPLKFAVLLLPVIARSSSLRCHFL